MVEGDYMSNKTPPGWLVAYSVAEDEEYSKDPQDWKYRGDYWEAPNILMCTHGNPDIETSPVSLTSVALENKDPHAIGKCEVCGKVLWVKIVQRQ